MNAFRDGETPEQIAQNYDSVPLEDICQVIAYYLSNSSVVDVYLRQGQAESDAVRAQNEARFPTAGIRERLMARRQGGCSSVEHSP